MAEVLDITLNARTKTDVDMTAYNEVREAALTNPGKAVIVSQIAGATDTSNKEQVKQLAAYRAKLAKESTLETPFKVATSVRMIEGRGSVALIAVVHPEA